MGEMLPEFWSGPQEEEESEAIRREPKTSRRSRKVDDIWTWVQGFGV